MVDYRFDGSRSPVRELRTAAQEVPDSPFITISGITATYAEADEAVRYVGLGLRALGIQEGDRVLILLPNCLESVWSWFGTQSIGAIDAPVSVEAPPAFLAYLVDDLRPSAVIGTPTLLSKIAKTNTKHTIPCAIVVDGAASVAPLGTGTDHVSWADLMSTGAGVGGEFALPSAYLPGTIMYSSGTTGPSKGVVLTHGYYSTLAVAHIAVNEWRPGYRVYCAQPLCHVDGRSAVVDALHVKGHAKLGTRFSASRFWDEVEEHDADVFFYVGTMIHLLHKQPPRPVPPTRLRIGMGSATPAPIQREFEARFRVELIEGYGMTELGFMIGQLRGETEPGHLGRALPWVDLDVVDSRDEPVPDGIVGELVARPRGPHVHMLGYWNRPEATVEAWRGVWFHTGDLVERRDDGTFLYIGRTKDSIRRRGENVSAWEVEQAATRHSLVLEAAAIGVPSDLGEEDVALLVVAHSDGAPDLAQLREFVAEFLPRFAVPRFIEIVDSLPKTPSERIAKGRLRDRGVTESAFDAEANAH